MTIDGCEYSKDDLTQRLGNLSQLGGARRVTLAEGAAKGTEAIDITTAAGLRLTLLPDRGMDISLCTYKGVNLVYITPNAEVAPAYYDAHGIGWLHTFFAGLLSTCGLTTIGAPGMDGDDPLGLHGRVNAIPATKVQDRSRWEGDLYIIEIVGTVEEARLFGTCLELTRTVRTTLDSRSVTIEDRITNTGYETAPFAMLYHINAGFPLLDAPSRLIVTSDRIEAHDQGSRDAMNAWHAFSPPTPGFEEQNFLHRMVKGDDGRAHAAMINRDLADGLGLAMSFDPDALPYLNEWKMMGQRDYVVGIEPCNAPCANRAVLRKAGLLPHLEPGQTAEHTVDLHVLDGQDELDAFEQAYTFEPQFKSFTSL